MNLSPNFTLEQLSLTEHRQFLDDNHAWALQHLENLKRLAAGLERVLAFLGSELHLNSGIRCPALNAVVGGSPTSQHMQGLAADFTCEKYGVPYDIARAIVDSDIEFDQIIYEFGRWVHISFSATPRRSILSIHNSATGYIPGIILKGMA